MCICFYLKSDIEIGLKCIAILYTQNNPFHYIPDIEWDIKEFTLLGSMNKFVIKF